MYSGRRSTSSPVYIFFSKSRQAVNVTLLSILAVWWRGTNDYLTLPHPINQVPHSHAEVPDG